jgi:hypothetical protein
MPFVSAAIPDRMYDRQDVQKVEVNSGGAVSVNPARRAVAEFDDWLP